MLRLLHTSSLALGASFSSFGERAAARREDFYRTFERLVETACREQVQIFLVTGDLFATARPGRDCLERVQVGLHALREAGIEPVLVAGRGDGGLTVDAVYRRGELAATLLASGSGARTLTVGDRQVRFCPAAALPGEPLAEGIDIAIAGDLSECAQAAGGNWQPAYLACGGRGAFQVLEEAGRPCGCRPGAPEGHDFSEPGPRCAALVDLATDGCQVTALPVSSRPLLAHALSIEIGEGEEPLLERIRTLLDPKAAVQLTLTGPVEHPLDLPKLRAALLERCFSLELVDRTSLATSRLVDRLAGEDTVRGFFLQRLLGRLATAEGHQRELLEEALREVLGRLGVFSGGGAA